MASIFADGRSALIGTGWLSHVPVEWQDALLDACRCYPAEPGRAITDGGEETGGIFAIVSGTASVYSAIGATETPLIHIAGTGFWFGLFPVTNGRPRIIAVTARIPCVIATVAQPKLRVLLDQNAELWRWLNLLSLESAALAVQALTDLYLGDNERRCAAVLLRVAGCREAGRNAPAKADLSQGELASLSNLSRATISLIVSRLAEKGTHCSKLQDDYNT